MKKQRIFLTIGSLFVDAGGLTKAVLTRANYLSSNENYDVIILTFDLQPNLNSIVAELYKNGRLSIKVKVLSVFFGLYGKSTLVDNEEYPSFLINSNYYVHKEINIHRYFSNDGYKYFVKFLDNGNYDFIDQMDESDYRKLKYRYYFYNNNLVCKEKYRNDIFIERTILNFLNKPVVSIWYVNKAYSKLWRFTGQTVAITNFTSIRKQWVMENIESKDVIFFDDRIEEIYKCFEGSSCFKIAFFHSDHRRDKHAKFLAKTDFFDKYVFLTEKQMKSVFEVNSKIKKKSFIIPHCYEKISENMGVHNRIVTISRLDLKTKDIITGIRAFAEIANEYKWLTYSIYGEGGDRDLIQNEINILGLSERVFLEGYTNNSFKELSTADLSISLSYYEGFGLSILESLSVGTPVIASLVDYGPAEMIQSGVNGFLCKPGDVLGVVASLRNILENNAKFKSNCEDSLTKFSVEAYNSSLNELLKTE